MPIIRFDFRDLVELADCVCLRPRHESDEGGLKLRSCFSQFLCEEFAYEATQTRVFPAKIATLSCESHIYGENKHSRNYFVSFLFCFLS